MHTNLDSGCSVALSCRKPGRRGSRGCGPIPPQHPATASLHSICESSPCLQEHLPIHTLHGRYAQPQLPSNPSSLSPPHCCRACGPGNPDAVEAGSSCWDTSVPRCDARGSSDAGNSMKPATPETQQQQGSGDSSGRGNGVGSADSTQRNPR